MDEDASGAANTLRAAGFRFWAGVRASDDDYDMQGHVSNVAVVRWCNQHRIRYVRAVLSPEWPEFVITNGAGVVVRDLHVRYESEGLPGESFVCGTRLAIRRGKAGLMEQQVVTRDDGRVVARVWLVQLFVRAGTVEAFPDWYWERIRQYETTPVPDEVPGPRAPWGPPS